MRGEDGKSKFIPSNICPKVLAGGDWLFTLFAVSHQQSFLQGGFLAAMQAVYSGALCKQNCIFQNPFALQDKFLWPPQVRDKPCQSEGVLLVWSLLSHQSISIQATVIISWSRYMIMNISDVEGLDLWSIKESKPKREKESAVLLVKKWKCSH